jgi:tetratricopeptide (TPR) repeat protein
MYKPCLLTLVLLVASAGPVLAQQGSVIPPPPRGFFDRGQGGSGQGGSGMFPPGSGVQYFFPYYYYWTGQYLVVVGPYGSAIIPGYLLNNGLGYGYPPRYLPNYVLPQQQQPLPPKDNGADPKPPAKEAPKAKDDIDQRSEMYRLLRAGNKAFASGQYEDALKAYEKSQAAAPMEAHPAFHAGQALVALGNYHKAFNEIQRGLRWQPHWPEAEFKPRALYGNRGSVYAKHLARLADAVEQNPNDDSLLFLLGYQLWFDGKRDQAEVLFKRAATLTLDRTHIDRFLKVKKDN